jgi:mRNA interferase MazF
MVIQRGDIWWVGLPDPVGSGPGFRRPALVIQNNEFNESPLNSVIVAAITGNKRLAEARGNVLLSSAQSGLPKESAINVTQLLTIDKSLLIEYISTLSDAKMAQVNEGLRLVLSLSL